MIAVLADDLTGAAELAGIALRCNLNTVLNTRVEDVETDVLVIATDSRSKKESEAVVEIKNVVEEVLLIKPTLVYKKIDSILRGHVMAETSAMLPLLNFRKALLIPANPSLGRTISNGIYFFHNEPIHTSSFAHDPEFAIASSQVTDMVRAENGTVTVLKHSEEMPEDGILVGEVSSEEDLKVWAMKADETTTLLGGGSGFFRALLHRKTTPATMMSSSSVPDMKGPALMVSGTTFTASREFIKNEQRHGGPVSYMPEEIMQGDAMTDDVYSAWLDEIINLINTHGKAIIAIAPSVNNQPDAKALRDKIARIVKEVFSRVYVRELLLEGGSTAFAILKELQCSNFLPVNELAPGVIRLQTKNLNDTYFTLKPGSYAWPASLWKMIY